MVQSNSGDVALALGNGMRLLLILLDISLLFYTIVHMIFRLSPVDQPVYWTAGAIEVLLAYLTYRFWIRSRDLKGLSSYRIKALVIILIAVAFPNIVSLVDIDFLKPASTTDLFFFCTALTLLIYSSYRINHKSQIINKKP